MPNKNFALENPHISGINPYNYSKEQLKQIQQQSFKTHQFIFNVLTVHEEKVLRLRYGIDDVCHTLREIGQILGISHESVANIEKRALERLRDYNVIKLMSEYTDETFDYKLFDSLGNNFPYLVDRGIVQKLRDDDIGLKFGENSREKANFFKNRTYVFDLLHELEVAVLKLKLGFEDKYLTTQQIAKKLHIPLVQARKIEAKAYSTLEQPKYFDLLQKYTDKTIDKTLLAEDIMKVCQEDINSDILKAIMEQKLDVVSDEKFNMLNIRFGTYGKQTISMLKTLNEIGVYNLQTLVDYIFKYGCIKNTNITLNTILTQIANAIDENKVVITDDKLLKDYNKHKLIKTQKMMELKKLQQTKIDAKLSNVQFDNNDLNAEAIQIDDMGFSLRVRNALRRAGIDTMEQLVSFYYNHNHSFDDIWDLGVKSKQEILDKLAKYDIVLDDNNLNF